MTFHIKNLFRKRNNGAFSLTELSVVIIVLSVVTAGVLSVSTGKSVNQKVRIGNSRMNEIYKALGSYVVANKRLPCPASIKAIKSSDSTYGTEGTAAGTCTAGTGVYAGGTNLVYGMVPVKTLGLKIDMAEDGFGNKIAYIVDQRFTTTSTFTSATAGITIQKYTGGAFSTIASAQMFALIGYGTNQKSAFGANSDAQNTVTSDTDEMYNDAITFSDGAKTATFTNTIVAYTERSNTTFDDVVLYKSRDDLLLDNQATDIVTPNVSTTSVVTNCTVTNGQTFGSGSVYSGSTTVVAANSSVTLACISNFGKALGSGSDSTCGRTATDRTSSLPTATCNTGGSWTVNNDCVACRSCTSSSAQDHTANVSLTSDGNCGNKSLSHTVAEWMDGCSNSMFNVGHNVCVGMNPYHHYNWSCETCYNGCTQHTDLNVDLSIQCVDGVWLYNNCSTSYTRCDSNDY